jgi:hypothetical protein
MNGNGKEGNNRGKYFKRRERDTRYALSQDGSCPNFEKITGGQGGRAGNRGGRREPDENRRDGGLAVRKWSEGAQDSRGRDKRAFFDRPKWTAPQVSTEPIPHPPCPYCGKPIKDMSTAIADRSSGEPSHFECVAARIAGEETLEKGDTVVYIGGGRFAVVHFPGIIRDALWGRKSGDDYDTRGFQIKKIFEWEDRENRALWRKNIEDHFSVI